MALVNFDTLTPLDGGLPGTAPHVFSATTDQVAADLVSSGSMVTYIARKVMKIGDVLFVNHTVTGSMGSGIYRVNSTGGGSLTLVI